jgi:hypothetical protein
MTGKYYSILEKNQDWDRGKNLEQTLSGEDLSKEGIPCGNKE